MTTPDNPLPQPTGTPAPLADWGLRAIGLLIDWAPVLIVNVVFFRPSLFSSVIWLATLAYIAYLGHFDGLTGQTPGKVIMGIRLVNQQGELIGSGPGIGRKFAHILDFLVCGLGWLLPLVDAKRQTIADKVMVTFVVTGAEKKPFSLNLWAPPQA